MFPASGKPLSPGKPLSSGKSLGPGKSADSGKSLDPGKPPGPRPIVYACSGCSDVAQLANEVALRLDHGGVAEMSCIAGVGGGVPGLVRIARSGRPVIAIDGCQMHCAGHCLSNAGVTPTEHVRLYERGLRKRRGRRYDEATVAEVAGEVEGLIARLPPDARAEVEPRP